MDEPMTNPLREALRERLKKLDAKATSAPWAWDARGEKINEWGLGVAFDKDEKPLAGRFNDDDAVYAEQVCHTEGATVNYNDAELICALRNNLPMIIAALAEPDEPIDMLLFCARPDTPFYAPPDESVRMPIAVGVGRDGENDKCICVYFKRNLTDEELRGLHDVLAGRTVHSIDRTSLLQPHKW